MLINYRYRPEMTIITLLILLLGAVRGDALAAAQEQTAGSATGITVSDTAAVSESGATPLPLYNNRNNVDVVKLVGKMIGYFILIVVMIIGLVYILKRFVYTRKELLGKNRAIQILSSTYIAPKKSLMLVEALDRLLILGVTDSQMHLITELKREEYTAYMKEHSGQKSAINSSHGQFGDVLSKILKRAKS